MTNDRNDLNRSADLFERAQKVLPGGVSRNTVFRRPHPVYANRGYGCVVEDVEGMNRIDFSNNMLSLIHGHAFPPIVEAVSEQLSRGTSFATATEAEVQFAELLCNRVSSIERIRFVNSGTEAVMTGIKAARAYTGKPKIAKVEGAYHGSYDYAEVSQTAKPANWGEATRPDSVPVVKGTPARALEDVVVIPFNQIEQTITRLDEHADEIACVLVDPFPHRLGFIWANEDYIEALYQWTRQHNCVLMFDEVITFRCAYGGAQTRFKNRPDLTALGKMIGGGFPVGAIGGSEQVMSVLDPLRSDLPYPHSGTFSANPISMTAGRVALEHFDEIAIDRLDVLGDYARTKLTDAIRESGGDACVAGAASLFRIHLKQELPVDFRSCYADADESQRVNKLVRYLTDHGMLLINTCSGGLSTPMNESTIDELANVLAKGLASVG